jgi:hypothetical protein
MGTGTSSASTPGSALPGGAVRQMSCSCGQADTRPNLDGMQTTHLSRDRIDALVLKAQIADSGLLTATAAARAVGLRSSDSGQA